MLKRILIVFVLVIITTAQMGLIIYRLEKSGLYNRNETENVSENVNLAENTGFFSAMKYIGKSFSIEF